MICLKKHSNGVLAACDSNLLGKVISEGRKKLHINKNFYRAKTVPKEEFIQEFLNADNVNLVGENTIALASEKINLNTMKIGGIPYAIIFKIK